MSDGVYRVVGTSEGSVTLLRVGDADGRRINTGDITTVDRETFRAFESAENPDGNRSLATILARIPRTVYWQVRAFVGSLLARPLPSALALAILLVGVFGDGLLSLPEPAFDGLALVGIFALAFVASGRL
ncbi:MAG: hypothetical protein ABEI57_03195 [Halapricum sp.]